MKSLIFAALLACVCAQDWYRHGGGGNEPSLSQLEMDGRPKRDVSGSLPVGDNGKLIGTLGDTPKGGLFGSGAYEHTLINNDHGRLDAQAYGTRVLNPNRDSTYYGGKLNWQDDNMHASVDAWQRIGGRAKMAVEAGGHWEPFKNSELSAGAYYSKREGRPSDYGGLLKFGYDF